MVPVFQGYHLPNTTKSLDLVGIHLTAFLVEMPLGSGLPGQQDLDIVENIKGRHCYVAPDFQKEEAQTKLGQWSLWARSCYSAWSCCSVPQKPQGCHPVGVSTMAQQSSQGGPRGASNVAQNVLLCEGSSLFIGFQGRVRAKLPRSLP